MLVSVRVINNSLVLNRLLGDGEIEADSSLVSGSGKDGEFEGAQGLASIAICFLGQVEKGVLIRLDVLVSKPPFGV